MDDETMQEKNVTDIKVFLASAGSSGAWAAVLYFSQGLVKEMGGISATAVAGGVEDVLRALESSPDKVTFFATGAGTHEFPESLHARANANWVPVATGAADEHVHVSLERAGTLASAFAEGRKPRLLRGPIGNYPYRLPETNLSHEGHSAITENT
jgi:hypothetical protein